MNVVVRAASIDDLEACFAVQKAADLAGLAHIFPPHAHPYPDDDVRARWRTNLSSPGRTCFVALAGEEIAGCAAVIGDALDSIAVSPPWWGTNVAPGLYDAAIRGLREAGVGSARLVVLEENARARRFYERRGWELDGRRGTFPAPPFPPLVGYTLDLTAPPRSVRTTAPRREDRSRRA